MCGINAVLHCWLSDQRLACVRSGCYDSKPSTSRRLWLCWAEPCFQTSPALLLPHSPGLSFSLPGLDLLQRWGLSFVLCKEYKYKVVPRGGTWTSVCWSYSKIPCGTSWHAVSSTSSAVRIFLCLLAVEEGKVPTNETGDSLWHETDWLGLLCK